MRNHLLISAGIVGLAMLAVPVALSDREAPFSTAARAQSASATDTATLQAAAAGAWRPDAEKARDQYRHPVETLAFFGVAPNHTVIEITPGGGWYTRVIAPYLKQGGGKYIAAGYDPNSADARVKARAEQFAAQFADKEVFGDIQFAPWGPAAAEVAPANSVDVILTFRNIHNWMGSGFDKKAFELAFAALKPGGVFGVVEHRLPANREQDPRGTTGYVHEEYAKQLAAAAGFEFVGASDVNNNPKDTADHPFGVWTLPPVSRTSAFGQPDNPQFDRSKFDAIGESDRFTLKFRKPLDGAATPQPEPASEPTDEDGEQGGGS